MEQDEIWKEHCYCQAFASYERQYGAACRAEASLVHISLKMRTKIMN